MRGGSRRGIGARLALQLRAAALVGRARLGLRGRARVGGARVGRARGRRVRLRAQRLRLRAVQPLQALALRLPVAGDGLRARRGALRVAALRARPPAALRRGPGRAACARPRARAL